MRTEINCSDHNLLDYSVQCTLLIEDVVVQTNSMKQRMEAKIITSLTIVCKCFAFFDSLI